MNILTDSRRCMKEHTRESIKIMILVAFLFFSFVDFGQTEPAVSEKVIELPQAEDVMRSSSSEPQRIELGKIGVVVPGFRPKVDLHKPMTKGQSALHYAGHAALGTIEGAFRSGGGYGGYGGAALVMLTPAIAIAGAIVGATIGKPAEKIQEAEDVLNRYLESLDIQEALRDRLLLVSIEQIQNVVPLDLKGPSAQEEENTYDVSLYPDIDTVLEIGIRSLGFIGSKEDIDPDLTLHVGGAVRIISKKNGNVLHSSTIGYVGAAHKFLEWSADNARYLQEEMDRAFQALADQINKKTCYLGETIFVGLSEQLKIIEELDIERDTARDMKTRAQGESLMVNLRPHLEQKLKENPERRLCISMNNLSDKRSDKLRIGERTAAFGVSMGNILPNRKISDYLSEALSDALKAAGHEFNSSQNDVVIDGEILKFWIETPATILYWDITAVIEIKISLRILKENDLRVSRTYMARKTERTYLWPSAGLIEKAVDASVMDLTKQIRADLAMLSLEERQQ